MRLANPPDRSPRHRRPWFSLMIIALAGLVAACGGGAAPVSSNQAGTTSASESPDTQEAFPVTIEHKYGSTEIPVKPERVVAAGFVDQDFALALGVTPVAVRDFLGPFPEEDRPWARELLEGAAVEKIDGAELNYEQIAALRPDVILYYSYLQEDEYEQLARIAPTVVEPEGPYSWQEQTLITGRALGLEDRAEEVVAEIQAQFDAAIAGHPEFAGKVAAIQFGSRDDGFYMLEPTDPAFGLSAALGFEAPETVGPLGPEQVGLFDEGDVVIVIGGDQQDYADDPLWQSLDAVREGRVVYFGGFGTELSGAVGFGSPLSLPYALEVVVPALAAALDGDPATAPEVVSPPSG